jgi:hypothetical protein
VSEWGQDGLCGTPVRTGFQSENVPSIATLNLGSVRYDASRTRLESGIPAACRLHMSPVVHAVSYALDTSRCMAAVYARSPNLPLTYSVKRSSCSVVSPLGKKPNCSSGMW